MVRIRIISVSQESGLATSHIYYPLWFVQFSVSWRRLFLPERRERVWVCVDGVRGVAHRADVIPSTTMRTVSDSDVLPLGIGEEGASKKARALADWWARTRLSTWWPPIIQQGETRLLHKVYLIERGRSGEVLRDSVTGEEGSIRP
jgi:hypothetical protein